MAALIYEDHYGTATGTYSDSCGTWGTQIYSYEIRCEPTPKLSSDHPLTAPRRRQPFWWAEWSNQFHSPGYRVFRPVYRHRIRHDRAQSIERRPRRARLCSSAVPMLPY